MIDFESRNKPAYANAVGLMTVGNDYDLKQDRILRKLRQEVTKERLPCVLFG